ncbi:MAG: flagellar M-ring protein FliF [Paludibacterium sp.]|uniref:flagellar basal-body MS-ring/collar protein FliF n=1 Tax=Paludibacterium sp. TaxID=1917523 RepID=UPI0025E97BB5|nr:flagellar basal-body MS-ring/collar protein FliF [Paludibacterium sp.]MBV8047817.1 flagellar M-ring protein FliF [Paludibacterium sp.]MBV8648717.1 flagellar M-ring protein FliF [Paludibacterium sp.]
MADLAENENLPAWRVRVNEVLERFKALPPNKKFLFYGAVAALFAVVIGLALLNREPAYKILFANLADRDGGQVTAALQQMNIPYQLGAGGVISVPSDQVYDVRLKLAAQGLPKASGVGFELMDNQKFGISQFAEQVNYQRAIEGELARTIESIEAVQTARVHIATPKQSVFVREQEPTTSSVMLNLYPGRVLDPGQIAGILHLVSSAVPGLAVKDVTIVDQDGNLLSQSPDLDASGNGLDSRQLKYVRSVEDDYAKRIEAILEPIFGKGNAHAQVSATLDFSQVEQTSETYRPNSSPNPSSTRSQQIVEKLNNQSTQPTGVPGSLSNQPPSAASAPITLPPGALPGTQTLSGQAVGQNGAVERDITTNYEVDKTISHTTLPQGILKRLTAAVVVNYRNLPDRNGDLKPTPLTAQEMAQVNNLVREAVGFNPQRGDSVNVVNAAFADALAPVTFKDKAITFVGDNAVTILKYVLVAIAALYLLLGVVRPVVREVMRPPRPPAPEPGGEPGFAVEGGRLLAVAGDEELVDENGEPLSEEERNKDPRYLQRKHYADNIEQAREIVKSDPRMAAQIIKEWISSDE